jgi:c-di-GMP-binding flagellar brake protein YcgR
MPTLQDLSPQQINEAVSAAVERHVPMTVTLPSGPSWTTVSGRALAIRDGRLWLELLPADAAMILPTLNPADKVGVSFKLKHHKHIFTATATGKELFRLEDAREVPVLSLCRPREMRRLQRRAYFRVGVPDNRIVRSSFWLGGKSLEPMGGSPTTPVWSGRVANFSAGGCQVQADRGAAEALEEGDVVGIRLIFGLGEETVYADGEVRHTDVVSDKAFIGFKFLGLEQTQEGAATLQFLAHKITEFQKATEGAVSRKA